MASLFITVEETASPLCLPLSDESTVEEGTIAFETYLLCITARKSADGFENSQEVQTSKMLRKRRKKSEW